MTEEDRKARLRAAYGRATQELREKHRGEFHTLYQTAAANAGVEWHPRLTAEQRAEQEFDTLVTQFPHLLNRVPDASGSDLTAEQTETG